MQPHCCQTCWYRELINTWWPIRIWITEDMIVTWLRAKCEALAHYFSHTAQNCGFFPFKWNIYSSVWSFFFIIQAPNQTVIVAQICKLQTFLLLGCSLLREKSDVHMSELQSGKITLLLRSERCYYNSKWKKKLYGHLWNYSSLYSCTLFTK